MEHNRSVYNLYYEWWKNIDKFIFLLIILLFITGLFFSLVSTSLLVSDKLDTNDYAFFFKHLSFVFLGFIIIWYISAYKIYTLIQNISNPSVFSLNCQIAVQKYIDYYPAFEMSRECKFIKVIDACMIKRIFTDIQSCHQTDIHIWIYMSSHIPIFVCSYFALRWNRRTRRASWWETNLFICFVKKNIFLENS